jgi:signal transduction histidine kinase
MLLSNAENGAEKQPPVHKATRQSGGSNGNGGPPSPGGMFCCASCGRPMADIHEALNRERQLAERLLEEHEAFKQSLSNDIYECFNQQLVGTLLHFQGFEQIQHKDPAEAQEIFRLAMQLLRDTLDEARRIANRLKPPVLDDFGVIAGVNHLLYEMRRSSAAEIEFLPSGDLESISFSMKNTAFRIIQELFANACNHGKSQKIRLEMSCNESILRIAIKDWGVGFDPAKLSEENFGLRMIQERARLLNGRTTIHSAPGKGTRIVVDLPLSPADK